MNRLMASALLVLAGSGAWLVFGGHGCQSVAEEGVLYVMAPEPSSFDPVKSNKAHEMTLLSLIHEPLVHVDGDASALKPGLASSWEASDDKRVWTFHLRADAATPDGGHFTSDDVLFSTSLYSREDLNSPRRPSMIVGGAVLEVSAPNEHTIVFRATSPAPFLPWQVGDLLVLEKARFEPFAANLETWTRAMWKTADTNVLQGFGPFFVASRDAHSIRLSPNPNYWGRAADGARLPRLRGIELTLVDDGSVAETRFANDSLFPARILAPTERRAYEGREGFEIRELGADESTMFFWLNQNPKASTVDAEKIRIFGDRRFRLGIAHALDRGTVIERAFLKNASPLYGPISPAFEWARPAGIDLAALTPHPRDLAEARRLVSEVPGVTWDADARKFLYRDSSGRVGPLGFVLYTTPSPGDVRRVAAETVAEQLGELGLTVVERVEEFNVVVKRIDETFDYEACLMFLESSGHASAMRGIFHSSSGMHFFRPYQTTSVGWEAEVDRHYDSYVGTGSEADLARALELWTRNQPVFYLATANKALVVRSSWNVDGHATTGKVREPLLARPYVERLTVSRKK